MVNGELPDGWIWKTIAEVTLPIEKVDPTQKPKKEFTYLDIASIDNSLHKITEPKSYYGVDAPSRARQLVQTNDVLFSTVRTYLEKIAQVPETYDGQIASTGFSVLRANGSVLPKYLFYYSLTPKFLEPLNELQRGTSYPAVRDSDVRVQIIPIAPLSEQERIVAKIEELFTQLEAGTSALERVQAGLRRYKASVLKAACEGKLVEKSNEVTSAKELIEQMGKSPLEGEDLLYIPNGWCWTQLGDLASHITSGSRGWAQYYSDDGAIFIRAQDINTDELVLDEIAHVDPPRDSAEVARTRVQEKDLLITITGANVTKTARVHIPLDEAYMSQHVGLVRPILGELSDYLYYWIICPSHGRKALEKFAYGAGKPGLNLTNIRELKIALPPLEEQHKIVAEVERRLSVARAVETLVEKALVRASRLRQAVLKSAFEGRLM